MSKLAQRPKAYSYCLCTLMSLVACTERSPQSISPTRDGGKRMTTGTDAGRLTASGAFDAATRDAAPVPARAPKNHRATSSCPRQRGPGSFISADDAGAVGGTGGSIGCSSDMDCTAGTNGRCFKWSAGPGPQPPACSYDGCFGDSDCSNALCVCRESIASSDANRCESPSGGNCRLDSDCGPSGFCSPSLFGCLGSDTCGYGYYCHTPQDACVDDQDCASGRERACGYDLLEKRWECKQPALPY